MTKDPYKYEPHSFIGFICGKQVCSGCGLIRLNNAFTGWCIDKGCNFRDHPQLEKVTKKHGRPL